MKRVKRQKAILGNGLLHDGVVSRTHLIAAQANYAFSSLAYKERDMTMPQPCLMVVSGPENDDVSGLGLIRLAGGVTK